MEKMPKEAAVFNEQATAYDAWFDENPHLYQSELAALKNAIPHEGKGIEIGVGSGRFADPLNVAYGVEPAENMAKLARARNITVYKGYAEALPIESSSFDIALMVTTVCFLSSISKAFAEVHRILKPRGIFVIGLLERNSQLGQIIENQKAADPFYQNADLHTTKEITDALTNAGFAAFTYWQNLFDLSGEQLEAPREGKSEGSFIVIKTHKV